MTVRLEDRGPVLVVHNRLKKRGAISPELYQSIIEAVELARQPSRRCIILSGGAFFCAGGDLSILKTRTDLAFAERCQKIELLHDTVRAMQASRVPLIAAIEGGAAGAGLSLALACDLIIAAEGAKFTAAYVKAGLTPDGVLTHILSRLVPRHLSMEMCLLGRSITAERFAQLGVVSQISPVGQTLETALKLAEPLLTGPPKAQQNIRRLVSRAYHSNFEAQLALEATAMAEAQGSSEAAEGISAFLEKRKPEFRS